MDTESKELAYEKLVAKWVLEHVSNDAVLIPDLVKGYGYRVDRNRPETWKSFDCSSWEEAAAKLGLMLPEEER